MHIFSDFSDSQILHVQMLVNVQLTQTQQILAPINKPNWADLWTQNSSFTAIFRNSVSLWISAVLTILSSVSGAKTP